MRKTKRNSGFSIMETVIALAMIAIVTIAALSVVLSAISARVKQANYSEAQDFAHNIIECYKAADTPVEFEKNAEFAGIELIIQNGSNYRYKCTTSRFTAVIEVEFSIEGSLKMDIDVNSNSNNDENKLSFTYTKGAK